MQILASAAKAKYSEPKALELLRKTGKAELWHLERQRGKPSKLIRFSYLEEIRDS